MHAGQVIAMPTKGPKRRQPLRAITGLWVEGYKSLVARQSIEIRPLTVLAGANSSGKSSIMQPLLMLKQTLEAPFDPGALRLDGPHVEFENAHAMFSTQNPDRFLGVGIEIGGVDLSVEFHAAPSGGVDISEMRFDRARVVLRQGMSHAELQSALPKELERFRTQLGEAHKRTYSWGIARDRCFLGVYLSSGNGRHGLLPGVFSTPSELFAWHITAAIHVPGLRDNPERAYKRTSTGPTFPGPFQHYHATIVHEWREAEEPRLAALNSAVRRLGLTSGVAAERLSDTEIALLVGRTAGGGAGDYVNIADVGLGVSQVLPVLVALLVAEPGRLVYLEQPEIHLHPRAQAKLAEIIARASARGVRVVVETHSDLLLIALQAAVAEGRLDASQAVFHWFERDRKGVTRVDTATLDECGRTGTWREDFSDVHLETHARYLDAVERRERSREDG